MSFNINWGTLQLRRNLNPAFSVTLSNSVEICIKICILYEYQSKHLSELPQTDPSETKPVKFGPIQGI